MFDDPVRPGDENLEAAWPPSRASPFAEDDEAPALSADAVERLVAGARERLAEAATPDDPAVLRARIAALRERHRAG